MDERLQDLLSSKNPRARIKVMKGHFATSNSHLNTYIDISTVKVRHSNARETAKILVEEYISNTSVDSIVCLDGTEVIGTLMAEKLADNSRQSLSYGNNISVITPEINTMGQIMFRDNNLRMIKNQQVIVLAASVTTGKTIFTGTDVPDYSAYKPENCPMCREGCRVEALVNSYGYSML